MASELIRNARRKAATLERRKGADKRRAEMLKLARLYFDGDLHARGLQSQMALRFGVNRSTICRDVALILEHLHLIAPATVMATSATPTGPGERCET